MTRQRLHSAYNPQKEAERFLDNIQELKEHRPSCIILMGAGEGYIYSELKKRFTNIKIIRIFYSREIPVNKNLPTGHLDWIPGDTYDLKNFLYHTIEDRDIPGIVIIEWPASANIWKKEATKAKETAIQFIRERTGTILTSIASGRRWFENIIRNILFIEKIAAIESWPEEILILASGPTLEKVLDTPIQHTTIALPSSLCSLAFRNIKPDAAISTDGNHYAKIHLVHLDPAVPLFAAFTAALPLKTCKNTNIIPIAQHTALETPLTTLLPYPHLNLPPHGTVAGTALQLAINNNTNHILIAGLDLASYDMQQHSRPHSFDPIWEENTKRITPLFTKKLISILDTTTRITNTPWRKNRALETYAGWFSHLTPPAHIKITRINPSPIEIPAFCNTDTIPSPAKTKKLRIKQEKTPDSTERKKIAKKYIEEIRETAREAIKEKKHTEIGLAIGGKIYYDIQKNSDTTEKTIKAYRQQIDKYIENIIEKYNLQ
ncbi:6-hydroxymethylpterin diphosphokinase MptE-like protein [Spirochaetia bacterium 38H-sp]|uniref:6-hydroxymethylpterin diphosphokinase MptE-like protein n=1 Tax=Rarispira pelagica TaxID=3141764 RepID=A0ABU9UBM2_9SPIR